MGGVLTWSSRVWNRVNEAPMRKSISCLASTALEAFSSGNTRFCTDRSSSLRTNAENLARFTTNRGLAFRHTSITCAQGLCHIFHISCILLSQSFKKAEGMVGTSNAIFSPSRSQSNHSMSHWHFLACSARFLSVAFLSCTPTM